MDTRVQACAHVYQRIRLYGEVCGRVQVYLSVCKSLAPPPSLLGRLWARWGLSSQCGGQREVVGDWGSVSGGGSMRVVSRGIRGPVGHQYSSGGSRSVTCFLAAGSL